MSRSGPPTSASALLFISAGNAILSGAAGPGGGGGPAPDPAIVYVDTGIRVMNADGSNQRTIFSPRRNEYAMYPDWSADGAHIIFWGMVSGVAGVYRVPVTGGAPALIVRTMNSDHMDVYSAPRWSPVPAPDGRFKILFTDRNPATNQRDLFLVNTDGTGLQNLTSSPGTGEYQPAWAPDATRIVAVRDSVNLVILEVGLAGGAVAVTSETVPLSGPSLHHPAWANTSDTLALSYTVAPPGYPSISLVDISTPGAPHFLLTPPGFPSEISPSFSPDDSRIVFHRAPTGSTAGILTINADGSDERRLTNKGSAPNWRHRP